jgi:hypothetical protein
VRTALCIAILALVGKVGPQPVTKADIEAKLRQVQRQVGGLQQAASGRGGRSAAAAGAAALLAAAYLLGRRRGRSSRAVVEVRRV